MYVAKHKHVSKFHITLKRLNLAWAQIVKKIYERERERICKYENIYSLGKKNSSSIGNV